MSDHSISRCFSALMVNDVDRLYKHRRGELDGVLDLGANIGIFSLGARILHPEAKIVAVEADVKTFNMLYNNVHQLGIVCDLGCYGEDGKLYYNDRMGRSVYHSFSQHPGSGNSFPRSIVGRGLKSWWEAHFAECRNLFIKMDVEGGEVALLESPDDVEVIRRTKQTTVEVHLQLTRKEPAVWLNWAREQFGTTHEVELVVTRRHRHCNLFIDRR